jgi:hypothetical protein
MIVNFEFFSTNPEKKLIKFNNVNNSSNFHDLLPVYPFELRSNRYLFQSISEQTVICFRKLDLL